MVSDSFTLWLIAAGATLLIEAICVLCHICVCGCRARQTTSTPYQADKYEYKNVITGWIKKTITPDPVNLGSLVSTTYGAVVDSDSITLAGNVRATDLVYQAPSYEKDVPVYGKRYDKTGTYTAYDIKEHWMPLSEFIMHVCVSYVCILTVNTIFMIVSAILMCGIAVHSYEEYWAILGLTIIHCVLWTPICLFGSCLCMMACCGQTCYGK